MNVIARLGTALLLIGCIGCGSAPPPPAVDAARATVTLEFNLGDEVKTIDVPDVADGTTLETVLRGVDEIAITLHGSGNTAFVQAIGDTATDASQGWTYKVDGQWSATGVGTTVLHPPTTVSWAFGDWEQASPE
jgi:hypothetical protein